jgi:hypothetical protein
MINTSFNKNEIQNYETTLESNIQTFSAKVLDVILSPNHPKYDKFGKDDAIGIIIYSPIESNNTSNLNSLNYAKPLSANNKNHPIKGETVLIFSGLPTVSTNKKEALTLNYYFPHPINVSGSSNSNSSKSDLNSPSNHKSLLPKYGDVIYEGRFNNSMRFSADENGNPITVIRNGSGNKGDGKLDEEDVNLDESTIIFSSKNVVPIKIAHDKLDSYNIGNDIDGKVLTNLSLNAIEDISKFESVENKVQIESDLSLEETYNSDEDEIVDYEHQTLSDDEIELDQVIAEEHASIETQNKLVEVYNGKALRKLSKPANLSNVSKYVGFIESDIPTQIKAFMDVIAYCEGTMGLNSFNGYDTVVLNCRTISGWTKDYGGGCPYAPVYAKDGSLFQRGGHYGRYQYGRTTWKLDNNGINVAFNKRNQDITCAKTIRRRVGQLLYDNFHKNMQEMNGVYRLLLKLAPEWASLPDGNSLSSHYSGQNVRLSPSDIQKLYIICYNKYSQVK